MNLHHHRIEVQPGGRDPTSTNPDNRYCFGWAAFASRTRTVHKGNPSMIAWRPGDLYEHKRLFIRWRWYPGQGQVPGVMLNPHNPGDPAYGGWEPENSSGVSAWAIEYFGSTVRPNGASGLILRLQCQPSANRHFTLALPPEVEAVRLAGGHFDIALALDITDGFDGDFDAAVNGIWRQRLSNVKTCWKGQLAYWPYEGSYNSTGVPELQTNGFIPAGYGRTPAEALADGADWPIEEKALWGAVQRSNPSLPAWKHVPLPDMNPATFQAPPEWGGTPPPPPPPPPVGDFFWVPHTPQVGQEVTFAVIEPLPGAGYGWDRTLDGIADGTGPTFRYAYQTAGEKTVVLMDGGVEAKRHTLTVIPSPIPPADTLPLTVLAQTSSKITYGWTPVTTGRGYTFWTNGTLRSRTTNPQLAQTSFSRNAGDVNEVRAMIDGPSGKHTQT